MGLEHNEGCIIYVGCQHCPVILNIKVNRVNWFYCILQLLVTLCQIEVMGPLGHVFFLALTSYFHGRQLDVIKDAEIVWTITSPCLSNVLYYALPECVIRGSASVHRFFFPRYTASRSACCRFIHTGIKQGCLLYYSSACLVLCMDMHYNSCF